MRLWSTVFPVESKSAAMAEALRPVGAEVALGGAGVALGVVAAVGVAPDADVAVGRAGFAVAVGAIATLAVWPPLPELDEVLAGVRAPEDVEAGAGLDPVKGAVLPGAVDAPAPEVGGAELPFVAVAALTDPVAAVPAADAGAPALALDAVAGATVFAGDVATAPEPTVAAGADPPAGTEATGLPPHPARIAPAVNPRPIFKNTRRLNLVSVPPVAKRLLLILDFLEIYQL